eukprot:14814953-Alexandrium_andersonii.AAC.1
MSTADATRCPSPATARQVYSPEGRRPQPRGIRGSECSRRARSTCAQTEERCERAIRTIAAQKP